MKKILFLLMASFLLFSCEDFLYTENYTKKTMVSFPLNLDDANQMITGVYNTLNEEIQSNYTSSPFFITELASDERFAGGGVNDRPWHAVDKLMNFGVNMMAGFWRNRYEGIFRANVAVETLPGIPWESEKQRNTALGEIHFLRGYYYFTLVQFFGNVPLILESLPANKPQSPVDEIYAQIASDLKKAIELLPDDKYNPGLAGRATKWAAESILARTFLFYTGFYNKSELPLAEGGSITKSQIVTWLEDCIANSGHDLVSDYRNLWPYTNEYTVEDYEYTKGQGLKWEGDGNKEIIFATKFAIQNFRNTICQAFGLRQPLGQVNSFPFAQGWGGGPISPVLWNEWESAEPNDIRRTASIFYGDDLPDYRWGADNIVQETGFWQKKYIGISCYVDGVFNFSYNIPMYGFNRDWANAFTNDLVHMRFSDVLLMHSELTETLTGINRVRARAGLSPHSSYSLKLLKQERRFELCFENTRFDDLRRWGDAETALEKQTGVPIKNANVDSQINAVGGGYGVRYRATQGFWPIPEDQINLSEGVLKQNPGWGIPEAEFTNL
jgi:hypothetical protein